ncbi:hypothetical protein E4K10_23925 [Streptomyces sp. T1317-0309]|nr:hypothetical protein E4K10_23925 [Streptomyces sp. T1317-0309]
MSSPVPHTTVLTSWRAQPRGSCCTFASGLDQCRRTVASSMLGPRFVGVSRTFTSPRPMATYPW